MSACCAAPESDACERLNLRSLFAPRSLVVVGASPRSRIALTVRTNLLRLGSATRCYFVNPNHRSVWGDPCYPELEALPEAPEAVLVAVRPSSVAGVIADAVRIGARAAIVPGGGVVEGGEAAAKMQTDVRELALRHGLALLGPNSMGVVDMTLRSAAFIGEVPSGLRRGNVAVITQSGAIAQVCLYAAERLAFSRIVASGVEAAVDLCDYLAYCVDDPATHLIVLFVEGLKRPELFLALADRALAEGKPVIAVKVGRSEQAREAALAHTGSLAGEDRAVDAAFVAAGVVRCRDVDELIETAALFDACDRLKRGVKLGRTAVVTGSTGEASMIADLAQEGGVRLPPIPDATRARISTALPTLGYINNPLDPWGAAPPEVAYAACFSALADCGVFDAVVLAYDFPPSAFRSELAPTLAVAEALAAACGSRADLLPVLFSPSSLEPPPELLSLRERLVILSGAREAIAGLAHRVRWEKRLRERMAHGPARQGWPALARAHGRPGHVEVAANGPRRLLPDCESLRLLRDAGVPVAPFAEARDEDRAVVAAERLGYPVAVKVDALGLPHKSGIGGVRLGLRDAREVSVAVKEVTAAATRAGAEVRGVLVQRMAEPGVEALVGLTRDAQFGLVVALGLGGVLAEALDDVVVRLAPLSAEMALAALDELKCARLLCVAPGLGAVDRHALAGIAARLSWFGSHRPDVLEMDLNPVIVGPAGAVAVDALVVLSEASLDCPREGL